MNRWSYILLLSVFLVSCSKERMFEDLDHEVPVVKIEIEEDYLWSPDSGLYVVGSNGVELGTCSGIANYNQDWEFPAYFSLIIDGEEALDHQKVGFKIKGNCTRANAMKSLGIYWRKEYGEKNTETPFFGDNSSEKYKRLFLRNSGNDFGKTHIKDAVITQIIKPFTTAEVQDYVPCVVYLNDEYWGIHNMRDMITPHHFKYKYGVEEDYVTILEGDERSPVADDGSPNLFLDDVVEFVEDNDMKDDANLDILKQRINLESYMDYIITQTYIANEDKLQHNVKWWRDATSADHYKWTWIIYDTDLGFVSSNVNEIQIGNLIGEYRSGFYLFNKLIENDTFKTDFLNRYLYFIDTVFEPSRVETIVYELSGRIQTEYENHRSRWELSSTSSWNNQVNDLVKFNNKRNEIVRAEIVKLLENGR